MKKLLIVLHQAIMIAFCMVTFSFLASTASAGTITLMVRAEADAFIASGSFADINYGEGVPGYGFSPMAVGQQNDASGNQIGRQLYRFNLLTGYTNLGPIISASLQLEVFDNFAGIPCNTAVYGLSDAWDEMTVTWNTQPIVDLPEIDSVLINPPWPYGEVFEYDVTSYVMAQVLGGDSLISFQQRGQDETVVGGVRWWQREGEGVSMPPIVGKQPWLSIVLDAPWTNENIIILVPEPTTITVDPYQDEYVIMVGNAYDWDYDNSSGKLFFIPIYPDGTFGNVSYITDLGYRAGAGIADFDNNGDLDFVAGAIVERGPQGAFTDFYLFENVGGGKFVQHLIASHLDAGESSDNRVGTFAVADFNEDGFKDFVAPIYRSNHVYLFTNNNNHTFTVSDLGPFTDPSDAKEGDFNKDGHMDFMITDYFGARVYLYEGDGTGKFTAKGPFDVPSGYRAEDITVGDFNEDGNLDIIVDDFQILSGGGYLYMGDGSGNFGTPSLVYSRPLMGEYPYGLDSFDFDNDGHRDLILSTYEFGTTGLVFVMKGNGDGTFQGARQIQMEPLGSVFPVTPSWIPRDEVPPVLTVPEDMTLECTGPQGNEVTFSATGSDNVDGPVPVTCTPASGSLFHVGATEVTCTASDKAGNTVSKAFTVTVKDTTIPNINNLRANPDLLWPANHKMLPVAVQIDVSDNCDPAPICRITSVRSNEPESGLGDGDLSPDWKIIGDLKVNLRAERSGKGNGRVYTIFVTCNDTSGNSS